MDDPIEPGEGPRLASEAEAAPDFEPAPRWRPAITSAMLHEDVPVRQGDDRQCQDTAEPQGCDR